MDQVPLLSLYQTELLIFFLLCFLAQHQRIAMLFIHFEHFIIQHGVD